MGEDDTVQLGDSNFFAFVSAQRMVAWYLETIIFEHTPHCLT